MKMEVRASDDIKILDFEGNLDTNTSPDVEVAINELIDNGALKLLANFEKLNFISSAGLRVLLATAKRLRGAGGGLQICGLNPTVQEVFDISGFGSILNVCELESDALNSF